MNGIKDIIGRVVHLQGGSLSAVEALRPFGGEVVPVFIEVLEDGTDDERLLVLDLLRHLNPDPIEIIPVLISLLHRDRLIKMTTIETLGYCGKNAVEAVSLIERDLESEDKFLRCLSAGAILRIAPDHDRALNVLESALNSGDESRRRHAEHYLAEAGV